MSDGKPQGALFASYNVHKCVGTDRRFSPTRIAKVICEIEADVVALQEADRRFGDRAGLLDLEDIARESGLMRVEIEGQKSDSHGWHGNMILVREASVSGVHRVSLPGLEPRGAVIVDLDIEHGSVRLVATHLGLLRRSRRAQVATILQHARPDDGRPVVMMGDFNEWRHRRTALRLPTDFGEVMQGTPSFPSRYPVLALDRILASPHHVLGRIEAHDTPLARVASDHLPIKARVNLSLGSDRSL